MKTITFEMLENAKEGDILASGFFENSPDSVYLTYDKEAKKKVRWVAVRGYIPDRAIYYEELFRDKFSINFEGEDGHRTDDAIKKMGHKLSKNYIDKLVKSTYGGKNSYRSI